MKLKYCEADAKTFYIGFNIRGTEFETQLDALKQSIPTNERRYNRERRYWEVVATPENEQRLRALYPDFAKKMDVIRSQLSLF